MAIESLVSLETESVHRFRLIIEDRQVDVDARVASCHARPGERRQVYAIGMEFQGMPPDAQERLSGLLDGLPPFVTQPPAS